jgi:ribonuclease HII
MYICTALANSLSSGALSSVLELSSCRSWSQVTRDRLMCELDAQYPKYNFRQHKVTLASRAVNAKTQK